MSENSSQTATPTSGKPPATINRVSVLVPVYNSQKTIGPLVDLVVKTLSPHTPELEIVLVNDGSPDDSHNVILQAIARHPGVITYVRLARNFGEHNAVMCGLRHVTGNCAVIIDDDFQNPPDQILLLIKKLREGYDVVFSYYETKRHSWFRNLGSSFNDRVATWMLGKPRGLYLSSFKALNRFLIDEVTLYDGPYPYLDGLVLRSTSSIGQVLCDHREREVGESNYTLLRLVKLWLNMFTGFSILPLRAASFLGFVMSAVGFAMALFFIISWSVGGIFKSDTIPPGWASLIVSITIFAGLQLSVLGVVGEYLGRVFQVLNRAPQFVIREIHSARESDTPSTSHNMIEHAHHD